MQEYKVGDIFGCNQLSGRDYLSSHFHCYFQCYRHRNPLHPVAVGWTPSCPPQVVHDFVYLRQEPSLHAPILGKRQRGDTFFASEETWDGWVKLHGQPGVLDMFGAEILHVSDFRILWNN